MSFHQFVSTVLMSSNRRQNWSLTYLSSQFRANISGLPFGQANGQRQGRGLSKSKMQEDNLNSASWQFNSCPNCTMSRTKRKATRSEFIFNKRMSSVKDEIGHWKLCPHWQWRWWFLCVKNKIESNQISMTHTLARVKELTNGFSGEGQVAWKRSDWANFTWGNLYFAEQQRFIQSVSDGDIKCVSIDHVHKVWTATGADLLDETWLDFKCTNQVYCNCSILV